MRALEVLGVKRVRRGLLCGAAAMRMDDGSELTVVIVQVAMRFYALYFDRVAREMKEIDVTNLWLPWIGKETDDERTG